MARSFTRAFTGKDGRQGVHFLPGCTLPERQTPWGAADAATTFAEGIVFYSTPSHGGFKLSAERLAAIPAEVLVCTFGQLGERGWFEEAEAAIAAWKIARLDHAKLVLAAEDLLRGNVLGGAASDWNARVDALREAVRNAHREPVVNG